MNFAITLPLVVTVCARLTWPFPGPALPQVTAGCPAPVVNAGGPERPAHPLTTSRPSR